MDSARLPPKKEVLDALLEHSSVFIHLDPRGEDVMVPNWFKKQPQLVLQIGLNLPVPIRDLQLTERGVTCTLSFNRSPHLCVMPWGSIFALVAENGRGMVWPDDVPPEVVVEQQGQAGSPAAAGAAAGAGQAAGAGARTPKGKKARSGRGKLRAVPGGAASAQAVGAPEAAGSDEVTTQSAQAAGAATPAAAPAGQNAPDAPAEDAEQDAQKVAPSPRKAPRPSYLRVVK